MPHRRETVTPLRADARRNRDRILSAAAEVFDEHGPSGSTEEVARRAGVAVGTVFRHFPTKDDLLAAIMKGCGPELAAEAGALAVDGGPEALFTFFTEVVERAARTRTVVHLLTTAGTDVGVDPQIAGFGNAMAALLARARDTGAVRGDVRMDEVVALLTAACQGAVNAAWSPDLRRRTVARLLDGLRPPVDPAAALAAPAAPAVPAAPAAPQGEPPSTGDGSVTSG